MMRSPVKVAARMMGLLCLALVLSGFALAQPSMHVEDGADRVPLEMPQKVQPGDGTVRMYGVADLGHETSQFFKILASGDFLPLGPNVPGMDIEGIGLSPITGDLYATSSSGPNAGSLYKISKTTGAYTLVGNTGIIGIEAASFHPTTGLLWVYQSLGGLWTVDVTNAHAAFQFLPTGTGVGKTWEGLAWDPSGTALYGQQRSKLYRTNPVSHATQVLCTTLPQAEALEFSPDGTLYAGQDPLDPEPTRMYTIDIASCAARPAGFEMPVADIESIAFEKVSPPCTGHIGDYVWNDLDADGVQDAGEPGIPGVTVVLKDTHGGQLATTVTDASGLYGFNGLCAGDYRVETDPQVPHKNFFPSTCNVPPDDTIDNDCSPAIVTLAHDSTTDTTIDFGYHCNCDDGDYCTDDNCDPDQGCAHTPHNCDDGSACTTDSCAPSSGCEYESLSCEDHDVCTLDDCDPDSGCTHTRAGCDDGNACTRDACDPVSGCSHTVIDCNDHSKCTNDSCDPEDGCVHEDVKCEDGNACNIDACDPASGCSHTVIDCNDHSECTNDSCNRESGCENTPVNCDDGSACTTDACAPASGCSHTALNCNDHDKCTNDSCNPASGCVFTTASCDDGNACTVDGCDPASGCAHTALECGDADTCTNDGCNPASGCVHAPVDCNDDSECTTDACDPASGCAHTTRDCDDHDKCTNDGCNPATGCVNTQALCDDGNACSADACDPAMGCTHNLIDCNDNNACTNDSCRPSSGCAHGPVSCDDGIACTADSCDPVTGCAHLDGTPSASVNGPASLCLGAQGTYASGPLGPDETCRWSLEGNACAIVGADTDPAVHVTATAMGTCTLRVTITNTASGCSSSSSQGVCVQGHAAACNPVEQCTVPYPFPSSNPLTSVVFSESDVLRAFTVSVKDGCTPDQIRIFYNDEHALTLGVRRVVVKTSSGSSATNYPLAALPSVPGGSASPAVGTTLLSGNQAGTDLEGRPMFPALYITDITNNPGSLAGDWQFGGTPIAPHAVFGTWKGAVRVVDKTRSPALVTITPDADPTVRNHWNLGAGDPAPAGLVDQGYGAEVRWDVSRLGLTAGHTYRVYFMVHDGDQNKTGGDVGHGCAKLQNQPPTQISCEPPRPQQCTLGYPSATGNPRSSVVFSESDVLRAFSPDFAGPGDSIKVWYNDEHALTLGVRQVSVKTAHGTTSMNFPVSPLPAVPGGALGPHVGTTDLTGDFAGTDLSDRPMWPALFLTDVTLDPGNKACDWQSGPSFGSECAGHTAIPPSAVFGTWKAAVKVVDKTHSPALVSVTPDPDPTRNNWALAGGDPAPAGLRNEGYGAEARWSVDDLIAAGAVLPGHVYRVQFMVHDGDQNKTGGDVGQNCALTILGGTPTCGALSLVPQSDDAYPFVPDLAGSADLDR